MKSSIFTENSKKKEKKMKPAGELFNIVVKGSEFMIGSRVWGGSHDNSDYDFIYTDEKVKKLVKYLREKQYVNVQEWGGSGAGHKLYNVGNYVFYLDGDKINILSYKSKDIKKVKLASEFMLNLPPEIKEGLKEKAIRIVFFEFIIKYLFRGEEDDDKMSKLWKC